MDAEAERKAQNLTNAYHAYMARGRAGLKKYLTTGAVPDEDEILDIVPAGLPQPPLRTWDDLRRAVRREGQG